MDEWGRPDSMEELEELLAKLPDADDPYDLAVEVCGCATGAMVHVDVAASVYLLWACFTDWVEMKPAEEAAAVAAMRAAARQWPTVKDDPAARDRYFDHWMFDVMDVSTAVPSGWTMRIEEISAGVYRVTAADADGRAVTATGTNRLDLTHEVAEQARELAGENRVWSGRDAWILQSIVYSGRGGNLASVIQHADAINVDIPSRAQLEESVNKLAPAGLVVPDETRLRATRAARRLVRASRWGSGIRTVTAPLQARLTAEVPVPVVPHNWTLTDEDWQAAYDQYRNSVT